MKQSVELFLSFGLAASSALGADSVVVFNEIHYHPATNEAVNEWVELHNQMAIDIDLSAWFITGTIGFTFAEGTIIPGGEYLVIARDPAALQAYSGLTNVLGPFAGRLNNSSGVLRLRDRNNRLMDELEYRDGGKWPVAPDGSGATLAKRDPDSTSDAPANWTSSVFVGGTPGRPNFPGASPSHRRSLIAFDGLWRYDASGSDLGTAWRAPSFDDSAWAGRNDATLVSYWPFDGNATAVRGVNGAPVGAVTATADRNGAAGGALAFNGASQQYVSVPGGGGLNAATAGTVSLWVRWSGTQDGDCCGTFGAVLARQGNGLFSDDIIALNSANPTSARVVWRQSGGPAPVLVTGTTVVGTNWHHIAVTFANGGSTLYLDGVVQGTAVGASLNNNSGVPLSIGAWAGDGGGFSTAAIDDVAIWDQPLSAAQIAELAAQTKTPLDFALPESAVYFAGDGRLTVNDELRRTVLPIGPTTYYFRNTFQFADDPARTELKLDLAADDGAVVYLNGAEVYRHNMPGGNVSYSTLASSEVGDTAILNGISLPTTDLVSGLNVFAVEVHQASLMDAGMLFGAGLAATVTSAPPSEFRPLIGRNEAWKFDVSDADLGVAWRAPAYNDANWTRGAALFFGGDGEVEGVPPERLIGMTATASSEFTSDGRLAVNAVNGAGLVGNAHVNTPSGTMWLSRGTFGLPNDLDPEITFDLGAVVPLRWLKVWNYNEDLPNRPELLARGVASADVLVGVSTGAFNTLITGQLFNQAPGTETDFSQLIDLGGVNARFLKLDRLTNFPGGDFRFVGLSEVQCFRDADLKRTELSLGPVTSYFRQTFQFAGDPAQAELFLDAAVDDGAVFYLNGVEIYRFNMLPGAVTHSTLASNGIAHATFTGPRAVSAAALVRGLNVLAVEVHQNAVNDADLIFGAELTARISPPGPEEFEPGGLVFNELTAGITVPFQIELVNRSAQPIEAGGYVVRRVGAFPDVEFQVPSQTVAPGAFLVLSQATLGFGAAPGETLFLLLPGRRGVADAVEVHERPRARSPDGGGDWLTPDRVTLGASNSFVLHDEVVINEIMYHAPPTLEVPAVIGTNAVVPFTNLWRYEQSGADLGTAWRLPGYDDQTWLVGAGLFYATPNNLPAPGNTPLELGSTTYYFRAPFVYTGEPKVLSLTLRHVVDDGAVFYLNGAEIQRFNMAAGEVSFTNNATSSVLNAAIRTAGSVSATNLVLGTNVFAVEVHQAANTGDDVVFGAEITATVELVPRVPFSASPEQWVELFNRASNAVDLTGWRLDEGIDFRFSSNTVIPPGGYLVAAKDPAALLAKFPGLPVVGPYTNSLSHRGERLVLKDAADNPADVVHYFDDGRWPEAADAGGASLELRDPRADHAAGEAWAASDESGRSAWRTYSYRGVAAASPVGPDGQWKEFVLGLLDAGEVLLDDIRVIETPGTTPTNLLQNGTFDAGTNKWRIIGNHHGEVIDDPDQPGNKVLRLVATGATEHMSNHGETTFVGNRDVVNGKEYLISFRAKWLRGSRQLHTRLYFNRLARTTLLEAPTAHGTPGAQNSTFAANLGPTYSEMRHEPAVPGPFEPVTVSVRAGDPDAVAAMALWWRVDGGSWTSLAMTPDFTAFNDSGPQRFQASIPGKPAGKVVQLYVEGSDGLGAKSTFPAGGPEARALYQVDDGLAATNGLHNVRLVTLVGDADELFRTVNLMSNERIGCTVIYDEREIFYDVGLRLKGSEHSRTTTPRLGFNVGLTSEQRFRGVHHTIAIDRSESTGFGQREMLIHQTLNHCGGVPTKYHDLIQVMAPRPEYTGSAELQLARYTDVFLEDQFEHGEEGTVFEYELIYQLNSTDTGTPEGNKVPAPDSVVGTTIRNLGDDKEAYRWNFLIKNNGDRDDYSGLILFCKTMALTGTSFTSQITNVIDVDRWLRGVAVNALSGAGDSYGGDGAQHNVQFYVRPEDGRVIYFPHDVDAFFNATRPIVPNSDLSKLMAVPAYARAYYCHLLDIIETTYNADYMTRWAQHFGRLLPAQDFTGHLAFLVQRANYVTTQVNSAVPNAAFAITSNGGNNFGTTNDTITLTGSAPLSVKEIEVNGVSYPITWLTTTLWSLRFPLLNGPNALTVQGVDRAGLRPTNAVDAITVTNSGAGALFPVVINEWMADNAGPLGYADPVDGLFQDWFELFNPNTNAVNLAGFFLTDNLAQPMKWQVPLGTVIAPGDFLLVWADNQPEQNALSPGGHLHAAFQLDNEGEGLGLFSPAGVAQHVLSFGPQGENVSQGLFPDGSTNSVYFMTNFTPRAANTLAGPLQITEISFDGASVTLTWSALPGRLYQVLFKDNLETPDWTLLGVAVSAVGASASATDFVGAGAHRFYRVLRSD